LEVGEKCSQCNALVQRRRSRGWLLATGFIGGSGAIAALVGQHMFDLHSRGIQSSREVVSIAGDWAALGFFGGFLLILAIPLFLVALSFWLKEIRPATQ